MSQIYKQTTGGGGGGDVSTLTGNTGGAVSPDGSGNINTVGTGSTTIAGNPGTNTLTTQLTGLTNHAVLVGAGTPTITNVGPGLPNTVLLGQGVGADPSFGTVPNAALQNSSITVTSTGNTIAVTGSPVSLGGVINVDLAGGSLGIDSIGVDTTTGAGTNPVVPTIGGLVTFTGGQYASGTFGTRVITINSPSANTVDVEVQVSAANASTLITKNGVSHFDSASFSVDANGFVSMAGGGGFTWSDTSGTFTAAKNHGYFITGTATANLPSSPSQGDTIKFIVDHATQKLTIDPAGTQLLRLGATISTNGGTAVSNTQGDEITIVYRSSTSTWMADISIGTWTIT